MKQVLLAIARRCFLSFMSLVFCALTAKTALAQLKPGIVVEEVPGGSENERVGLQKGDVLLSWSRGEVKGEIQSPFDLYNIGIEQVPRGSTSLEGLRGLEKQSWQWGPDLDFWSMHTRPNLPPDLLSVYLEGDALAQAGKLNEAAERWQAAANETDSKDVPWLAIWFRFHAAEVQANAKQWKEADNAYQQALKRASAVGPEIEAQLLLRWGATYWTRDRATMEKYYLEALHKSQQSAADNLVAAAILEAIGGIAWEQNDLAKSEDYLRQALAIRQKLAPGSVAVGESFHNLSNVSNGAGRLAEAEDYERQALAIWEKQIPQSLGVANALNTLGVIAYNRGDLGRAEEYYQQGLAVGEQHPVSIQGVAINLSGLGGVALLRGDLQKAAEYYRRALAVRESLAPNSIGVARNLNSLAEVAWQQGDMAGAESYGAQALAIIEKQAPDTYYAAEIFSQQGLLAEERGDLAKAEEYFRKALAIHEKSAGDNLGVAGDQNSLGKVLWERRQLAEAKEQLRRALATGEKVAPGSFCVADSLHLLGNLAQEQGDSTQAKEYYSRALAIREKLAPRGPGHVESLVALASIVRHSQPDMAADFYEQALRDLEAQVARAGEVTETRSNFRARHSNYYRDYVDLLLTQKKTEPAFQVLERSRARSLLEVLAEAHQDIRKGVEPVWLERERSLQADIGAKWSLRIRLLGDRHTEEQVAAVDREIHELVLQYDDVEAQIRTRSPAYAALTQPQPLGAKEVQQLLDADTLLLEYSLGADRSYVFAVTSTSLSAYELPKRAEIDSTVRRLSELLIGQRHTVKGENAPQKRIHATHTEKEYLQALVDLSRMVLGPVAMQLPGKRLLIVSDGDLQYIPFAILSTAFSSNSKATVPLVAEHDIVNLPSASVLAVLRRETMRRKAASKAVAVLADPVFVARDDRVEVASLNSPIAVRPLDSKTLSRTTPSSDLDRSAREIGVSEDGIFPRLPFTRREAAAIYSLAGKDDALEALDFEASKATALSSQLKDYRIVHFATHGLLNNDHPELSGLVFSLVNKQGSSQDGFLRMIDIYNMELNADLVVLSACQTALGKEIGEEGLIGLTRGFMYAGAPRVVASLWKVDDEATAALMKKFYEGMLHEHQTPAQALRSAQQWMRAQKAWQSPYYWAGFVLQGEWK